MSMDQNRMNRIFAATALLAIALTGDPIAEAVELKTELFTSLGMSNAMFLKAPQGDANYVYSGNRVAGAIGIFDRDTGEFLSRFADLTDASGPQDGLLDMAFHPDFAANGLFYTYTYSNTDQFVRIVERKRSVSDPLIADPNYERQILQMPNQNSHNGGWLGFSPVDGMLYATTGDGGANQGANNGLPAQDPFDLHGKVLRVDVAGDDFPSDNSKNYAVPAGNPYADGQLGVPEVYALGLRHPFRASFDRAEGDLYIGDVGDASFEEINVLPSDSIGGENFGWRVREGSQDNPGVDDPAPTDTIDPVFEYAHAGGGASVTGGVVYRGSEIPALQGTYFLGDFVRRTLFQSFKLVDGVATNVANRTDELFPSGYSGGLVAIGQDGLGEMYVVSLFNRNVYRIVADALPGDFNDDGNVDAADYTVWRDQVGQSSDTLANDIDGGLVGQAQYDRWVANYGQTTSATATVPEPASLLAALLAISLGTSRRSFSC